MIANGYLKKHVSLSDLTSDASDRKSFIRTRNMSAPPSLHFVSPISKTPTLPNSSVYCDNEDSDVTYCESECEEHDDDFGDMNEGRKRRHIRDENSWKKTKAKKLRMLGEEYIGYRKPKGCKAVQDQTRSAKILGPRCTSNFCQKSMVRSCQKFEEETRKSIHYTFWKTMNWDQRRVYVAGLVTRSVTARHTKAAHETSRREGTLHYYLPLESDKKVQVCKQMFLNTLSLCSSAVQSWVKQAEFAMVSSQNIRNSRASTPLSRKTLTLRNFFDNLPKLPSHYARKETAKLYLEPTYHSMSQLFRTYKNYCTENEEPTVSRFAFDKEYYKKNLALYVLKKDMCDTCASHQTGNYDEHAFQMHILKKNRARQEKEADKKLANSGKLTVLTMDLEAVKVCPFLTASALYFKTKLTCHNFTIFNLATRHCKCYWFTETASDLTASTFVSFVIDYLEFHCLPKQLPIIIYSDGCTYQNRNTILSNALLNFSIKHNITITHKYLEPGHTQMECDSVHSAIERKLKNREIHLPSDYVSITKEARTKEKYEVVEVDYSFFKNYADYSTFIYKTIRPGRKAGDPVVTDLRAIQYNPDGGILIKLDFDEEWVVLPQRQNKINSPVEYSQLHNSMLPISTTKYNHLQQLKDVLPKDCHPFYDALPHF